MTDLSPLTGEPKVHRQIRQSCDRCHSQKVRCTRSDNCKTGDCDRCLRKGSQCVYSSSLPKGRPSLYRLPVMPSTASSDTSIQPYPRDQQLPDSLESPPVVFLGEADAESTIDIEMGTYDDTFDTMCPVGNIADFYANWWEQDHLSDNIPSSTARVPFHLDPALETLLPPSSQSSSGNHRSSLSSGVSTGTSSATSVGGSKLLDCNRSRQSSKSSRSSRTDKISCDNLMANLSELSIRSSQLLCFSRTFLVEALDPSHSAKSQNPSIRVQQSIAVVFKSINSWLIHGSAKTDITDSTSRLNLCAANSPELLQHIFSASNHLIEILCQLRSTAEQESTSISVTGAFPSSRLGQAGSRANRSETTTPNVAQDYSIVLHLALVCATLLLNKYMAVLTAFQRSAYILHAALPGGASESIVEPKEHMDAASRAHMQLVSVVQLCSYYIGRQNQALGAMMAICRDNDSHRTPMSQEDDPWQSVSFSAIRELKSEVEQHLKQLQQCLQIPF
ncbi:hypothetical protein VHEMI01230 [[Torrubiella] hemipterigena]|uniref:Zn(2)-C6 fungal-type domain-containing protein n=1 Tax=[Torrubiella] hemipterigena TaxID=1531966 RepID=A0A0A1SSI5_9HYPO|nr:hypothetical protein VHEMI01230 [[Torrubiella] hemipterigena]